MDAASTPLEDLAPAGQHVVQRFLEVRGRFSEVPAHLLHVLLVALLDLVAEHLLQGATLDSLFAFCGMISDHVGHQRARESARLLVRVIREKRVDGFPLHDRR